MLKMNFVMKKVSYGNFCIYSAWGYAVSPACRIRSGDGEVSSLSQRRNRTAAMMNNGTKPKFAAVADFKF